MVQPKGDASEKPNVTTARKVINGDLRDFPLCGYTKDGKPAVLVNEANWPKGPSSYRRVLIKKDPNCDKQYISTNGEVIEFESLPRSEFKLVIKEMSVEKRATPPAPPNVQNTSQSVVPNKEVATTQSVTKTATLSVTKIATTQQTPVSMASVDLTKNSMRKSLVSQTANLISVVKKTPANSTKTPALAQVPPKMPKAIIYPPPQVPSKMPKTIIYPPPQVPPKMPRAIIYPSTSKPSQTVAPVKSSVVPPTNNNRVKVNAVAMNKTFAVANTNNTPSVAMVKTTKTPLTMSTVSKTQKIIPLKLPNTVKTLSPMTQMVKTPNKPVATVAVKARPTHEVVTTSASNTNTVLTYPKAGSTFAVVSPLSFLISNQQELLNISEDDLQINQLEPSTIIYDGKVLQKNPLRILHDRSTNTDNDSSDRSTTTQDLIVHQQMYSQTDESSTQTKECQTESDYNRSMMNSPLHNIDDLLKFVLTNDDDNQPVETHQTVPNYGNQNYNAKAQFFNDLKRCIAFDASGNLPIHAAVVRNNLLEVKRQCFLLRTIQRGVNVTNSNNMTPLQLAVLYDVDPQIIYILVDSGADISVVDSDGNSLIHLAVLNSQDVILTYLVKVAMMSGYDIDSYNYEGCTPLILCASTEKHEMASILLGFKANPNVRDQKSGRTALFHAIENNDEQMVKLLLQYRADAKIRNFFGTSPHDATYELDNVKNTIKLLVMGKDVMQNRMKLIERRKRRLEGETEDEDSNPSTSKRANLNSIANIYTECS